MKIALLQIPLIWENTWANRGLIEARIASIPEDVELIILPEMFTTGFTMTPETVAETMDGDTVQWLKTLAKNLDTAICGSIVIQDHSNYRNRCLFVFPSGEIEFYDKRHLFTMAGEHKAYTRGEEKVIVNYKKWKICLQICYDLRFPVFSRNVEDYDLLIYVANWPQPRISQWDALLKARAIENMCYVIGVNRVGTDNNNHNYPGHSQVISYSGECIVDARETEGVFIADIHRESNFEARENLPFLNDRDDFTVN